MQRLVLQSVAALTAMLLYESASLAAEAERDRSVANGVAIVAVDEPAFPEPPPRDPVRIWAGSSFAPAADFGAVDLTLFRPELRVRARLPVDDIVNLQITADFRPSFYDTDGDGALFPSCPTCRSPDDFYSVSLGVQGGVLLNRDRYFFRDGEQWVALATLYGRARWQPGAFEESLTPGLSLGLGYTLPGKLRIAVAARIERALDGDGVTAGPTAYLRWDITRRLRLRNRGLGLQLEYRPSGRWEVFVTGFRASDQFRLDRTSGAPPGTTFQDRQVAVGGGIEWKIHRVVRLIAEAGALVDRRVSVDSRSDGRLGAADGDVSPYFVLRTELRP